jgi:pimeloyl-ACP methyl ester carboxylesterase
MEWLDRDGVRIRYDIVGTGPAILLTHGFGASAHMFRATAAALAGDHTVITWDIRGHGASDYPVDGGEYSVAKAIGDMAALLDAAGFERAVLAGHSLGGYLSLAFNLAHPQRVRALILNDTGPGYRKDDGRAEWNRLAERYALSLERSGLAGLPGSSELTANVHRDEAGLIRAARGILAQHDATVIESLPTIAAPTLVIVGELDTPFVGGSQYMAAKIPNAQLVVIGGADHAPNMSHPAEFDAAVRSFLGSLPPA